ncbi:MAG: purine-nucleoside phosphorylase [Thermoanaerobaculia bacterium]|nr:purine-nucleoside phosphorylase [Thermoanaerobaculia bacterium]
MFNPTLDPTLDSLLDQAVRDWDARGWPRPKAVVVSGSGLAHDLHSPTHGPVPLAEILPFETHAIEGHPHRVELIEPIPGRPVLYYRGRLHYYQGYSPMETVFPVRLAARLGARVLIMTNAAGGLDPAYRPGDLVMLKDHLNLTGLSPLRGHLPADFGPRFPDMTGAYDPELRRLAHTHAERLGIGLAEGVYAGLTGPSYETAAEVRMFQILGGQLVGMSTVLEVIAAHAMGVRCLVFSLVTNLAAGVGAPLDHEEVLVAGKEAGPRVVGLLRSLLEDSGLC